MVPSLRWGDSAMESKPSTSPSTLNEKLVRVKKSLQKNKDVKAQLKRSFTLKHLLTKNLKNHPLYFKKKEVEQEEDKIIKILEEMKIGSEVLRPIEEKVLKFKRLQKERKYLVVVEEHDGKLLLRNKQDLILVQVPKSAIPPPPSPSSDNHQTYLIRSGGLVKWSLEER
jgi:hypothetical protein